jgi:hypothetical protein
MQPLDYSQDVQTPFQAALQGYGSGVAIRNDQMQRQQQEATLKAQEQQRLQQQQMQADLAGLAANPTPAAIAQMSVRYPQLSEQFKRSHDMMSAEQQSGRIEHMTQVYAAAQNGRPDVAATLLKDRATAMRNSGNDKDAKAAETMAQWATDHPESFKTTAGLMLSSAMGPDKFATTFATLGDQGRAAAKAPLELEKAKADAAKAGSEATISAAKAEVAKPMAVAELQKAAADIGLTKAQTTQSIALTRKYNAETQKAVLEAATGDPSKAFDAETKLRKEYADQTKGYTETVEGYRKVKAARDNAVGDVSLIFGYMKMLDPGSVVREGEYATAANTRGVPETVMNLYNRIIKGERLTPGQRENFVAQAGDTFRAAEKRETEVRAGLDKVIRSYKLNADNVFGSKATESTDATPAAAPGGAPKKIATDADYNALPSGSTFIAPDGTTRRKP